MAKTKSPILSTEPGYKELERALIKGNNAIGWKNFTSFLVNWCRRFQPEDHPVYSLHYWLHDSADPVIYPKKSFRVLIELKPTDEELERKLTVSLVNNHFAYTIHQSHDEDPVRIYISTMIDRIPVLTKILKRIKL